MKIGIGSKAFVRYTLKYGRIAKEKEDRNLVIHLWLIFPKPNVKVDVKTAIKRNLLLDLTLKLRRIAKEKENNKEDKNLGNTVGNCFPEAFVYFFNAVCKLYDLYFMCQSNFFTEYLW